MQHCVALFFFPSLSSHSFDRAIASQSIDQSVSPLPLPPIDREDQSINRFIRQFRRDPSPISLGSVLCIRSLAGILGDRGSLARDFSKFDRRAAGFGVGSGNSRPFHSGDQGLIAEQLFCSSCKSAVQFDPYAFWAEVASSSSRNERRESQASGILDFPVFPLRGRSSETDRPAAQSASSPAACKTSRGSQMHPRVENSRV